MTQEEKQPLLKDLCARLPYGVICKLSVKGVNVSITEKLDTGGLEHFIFGTMNVSPYLRPMNSMTEEEKAFVYNGHIEFWVREDYCNEHHLDYCGLIEKGLALEAPEDMYK